MTEYLRIILLLSFVFAVISLLIVRLKASSFALKTTYAKAAGSPKEGIIYSFTKGMSPFEKESAKNHMPSYVGGIVYHIGIFTSIIYLMLLAFSVSIPEMPVKVTGWVSLLGFICGLALLIKRTFSPMLKSFSSPDDYISNIVVSSLLLFCFLQTINPQLTDVFFVIGIVLFVIMPFGKIRHCIFFFSVRFFLGTFFGRRGVFPTGNKGEV